MEKNISQINNNELLLYTKKYKKAQEVSKDFEGFFVTLLLEQLTKGLYKDSLFNGGTGSNFYRYIYFQELSKEIAASSDLGIEKNVFNELVKKEIPQNYLEEVKNNFKNINKVFNRTLSQINGESLKNRIFRIVEKVSKEYQVDKNLILAIIKQESGFNPYAISKKGAKGLMQLMDSTAAEMGVTNPWNIEDNIKGGVKYFKILLNKLGDKDLALAAYNSGIGNVLKYKDIPPFPETINYVFKVNKYYEKFKKGYSDE